MLDVLESRLKKGKATGKELVDCSHTLCTVINALTRRVKTGTVLRDAEKTASDWM